MQSLYTKILNMPKISRLPECALFDGEGGGGGQRSESSHASIHALAWPSPSGQCHWQVLQPFSRARNKPFERGIGHSWRLRLLVQLNKLFFGGGRRVDHHRAVLRLLRANGRVIGCPVSLRGSASVEE